MADKEELSCSFCGKGQKQVKKLIAGPEVFICDGCVHLCADILTDDVKGTPKAKMDGIPTPTSIREFLDQYIIGQEHAKMIISVAVRNHYMRLANPVVDDVELEKSNLLLVGPSGVGKCTAYSTKMDVRLSPALYDKILENRRKRLLNCKE